MLARLLGSNTRTKILKLFLLHPEERYYIRQVSRDIDLQVNSVRRELENLEKFGLFVSEVGEKADNGEGDGNKKKSAQEKKYFKVNKEFPLFEDIKSLVIKSQILHKEDIVLRLKKAGNPKLLVLSGIFVNNLNSPIDVLIVGRVNRDRVKRVISGLEKDMGREINFSLMSPSEFKYRRDIVDIFLYNILEGEKIVVIDELGLS